MVIVDRSFSDLYEVALHKFHGYLAVLLFKLGTFGWDSHSDVRFYKRGIESGERKAEVLKAGLFVEIEQQQEAMMSSVEQNSAAELDHIDQD